MPVHLNKMMFDNPSKVYYAGQMVTGRVIIHLKKEIKIRGIFLQMQGKASVIWNETNDNSVAHIDKEYYFDKKYTLRGTEGSNKIGPGEFIFPFSVNLPLNLPSSFEGRYGYIRYTCTSIISQPWRDNLRCKAAITVLEVVDLNSIPGVDTYSSREREQKTGCCLCKTGTIWALVAINKRGYVAGENMYIQADIRNFSEDEIHHSCATLYCLITYKAKHHAKRETRTICEIGRGGVSPGRSAQWVNQELKIPPVPPTRLGTGCKLINIEYFLKFTVVPLGAFNTELDFTLPIIIGSIPLRTDFDTFAPHTRNPQIPSFDGDVGTEELSVQLPPSDSLPSLPIRDAPPPYEPPQFNQYPDLPPPSYEECVYGFVNIHDEDDGPTSGEFSFAPRYMYYNHVNPRIPTTDRISNEEIL